MSFTPGFGGFAGRGASGGFTPAKISTVVGWHRLADRTDTGTLDIPDVLGGPSATQASASLKPTFSTSNGYPIAVFDGTDDHLTVNVDAANNTSPGAGFAAWLRIQNVSGQNAIFGTSLLSGANANRNSALGFGAASLLVDVFIDNTNVRRGEDTNPFVNNVWAFLTWEYDGTQGTDATKCLLTFNGTPLTLSFSDSGGSPGAMPATLVQPTGVLALAIQRPSPVLRPFSGEWGPNIYWLDGQLTSQERTFLMNFEDPS